MSILEVSKKLINFFFILFYFPTIAFSDILPKVSFVGNHKTQVSYLMSLFADCHKKHHEYIKDFLQYSALMQQCFLNSYLFSEVIFVRETENITITLVEKNTLILIPTFTLLSGRINQYGLVLIESNLLGLGINFYLGGGLSQTGYAAFGLLNNPSLFNSSAGFSTSFLVQDEVFNLKEKHNKLYFSFGEKALVNSLGINYKFFPFDVALNFLLYHRKFYDTKGYTAQKNNRNFRTVFQGTYDQRNYKLYFFEGSYARAKLTGDLLRTDQQPHSFLMDVFLQWQSNLIASHAMTVSFLAGIKQGGEIQDAFRLGSQKGFRGIESKTAFSERYVATAIDYQIPLFALNFGTLTWGAFTDLGQLYHSMLQHEFPLYRKFQSSKSSIALLPSIK